jgi:uncharacterized membrane protein
MDIIIYLVLVLVSFLIYIKYNKISLFLFKKAGKNENKVQIDDEKNSKRKKLGSPRKDK